MNVIKTDSQVVERLSLDKKRVIVPFEDKNEQPSSFSTCLLSILLSQYVLKEKKQATHTFGHNTV